ACYQRTLKSDLSSNDEAYTSIGNPLTKIRRELSTSTYSTHII
ncbi:hypothetical protein TNCV_1058931, partial [Trichonephila clavipes]